MTSMMFMWFLQYLVIVVVVSCSKKSGLLMSSGFGSCYAPGGVVFGIEVDMGVGGCFCWL